MVQLVRAVRVRRLADHGSSARSKRQWKHRWTRSPQSKLRESRLALGVVTVDIGTEQRRPSTSAGGMAPEARSRGPGGVGEGTPWGAAHMCICVSETASLHRATTSLSLLLSVAQHASQEGVHELVVRTFRVGVGARAPTGGARLEVRGEVSASFRDSWTAWDGGLCGTRDRWPLSAHFARRLFGRRASIHSPWSTASTVRRQADWLRASAFEERRGRYPS